MKCSRLLFVPIIVVLSPWLMPSSPSYAEVKDDIKEIKKDLSEVKKELQEIKQLLKSRPQIPPRSPVPTVSEASIDDDPILGEKDAPLTLIEFSDYQCPFCGRFARDTLPMIKKEFIEKGKVRHVFRDFPVHRIHPQAQKAAEAAQCAGGQDKYWEMHDLIFENQKAMEVENLRGYAEGLGLNMKDFNKCLDDGRYAEEVMKDLAAGGRAGIRGTPSFILGRTTEDGTIKGRLIVGAQPYQIFKTAIEALLKTD